MTVTEERSASTSTSTSSDSAVEARPVAGFVGAEVSGVDLSTELTDAEVADIRTALLRHKVIFFRDQDITPEQQIAFGRRFGEVTPAHPTLPSLEGYPEILELGTEAYTYGEGVDSMDLASFIENHWHTDVTFVHNPPLGSILRGIDVPEYGGATGYVSLVAAYEGLSPALQDFADGLHAVHRNELHVELGNPAGLGLRNAFTSSPYWTEHPVVRVHPETGEKALFVNPNFTSHIVGLRNAESRAVLELLYAQLRDPRYSVHLRWEPGTIAFWDNRATAHLAAFDHVGAGARKHHRITLAGDIPVGPDGFESKVIEGGEFT